MASKIGDRLLQVRKFAQTAAKHADSSTVGRSEPLRQTKLPNGILVASVENYSPISRIGVYLRAGSRYETSDNLGITHTLRNAAGLTTKSSSIFGITRNIDYNGGLLTATTTRDNFIYLLENVRDKNLDTVKYLVDSIARPEFKPWELEDHLYRLKLDTERYELDAQSQLADCLHRAAFRGGLSQSLHIKSFNIGKHDRDQLLEFTRNHFTAGNTVVVGLGVDHDQLVNLVQKEVDLSSVVSAGERNRSKYIGGDCRQPFNTKLTFATVVTEGLSLKNKKDVLVLELFAKLLGEGPRVAYGNGAGVYNPFSHTNVTNYKCDFSFFFQKSGKLQQAVNQIAKEPFKVGAINHSYLDSGLFGFTSICDGKETKEIVKLCVASIRKAAKDFNETDLKIAK